MKSSDEVFDDLLSVFAHVYSIVDSSVEVSLQDFQNRGRPFEPHHFASGVRHEAKCRLLELAGILPLTVRDLANNGLFIVCQDYAIRIRKADEEGGLPPTNGSPALMAFYEQIPLPLIWMNQGQPTQGQTELNLVIIWDTDAAHHLAWVEVVCPLGENEVVWRRPIPHPATIHAAPLPAAEIAEDDFTFEQVEEDDESGESSN